MSKITILMASAVGLSTTPQHYKFSEGIQFGQNYFGEVLVFPEWEGSESTAEQPPCTGLGSASSQQQPRMDVGHLG